MTNDGPVAAAGATDRITVVGIGADGWDGLSTAAREALLRADVVVGSERQLGLVRHQVARTEAWPSPILDAVGALTERFTGSRIVVLASGDPMFYGIGSTLVRHYGADRVTVLAHTSSVSLAAARLGWDLATTEVISAVGRPLAAVRRVLFPGRRILVLVGAPDGARQLAHLLRDSGFGPSRIRLLVLLGGPDESITEGTAQSWSALDHDPIAIVAIETIATPSYEPLALTPGLPDDAYLHDGALTKREIRAMTVAALAPRPGELLWDVGAGSGSIAIEWMRAHPANRAVAIEPRADRRERIARNAERLGVPGLVVVDGEAPAAFAALPIPDAIFVGGGLTDDGVLDACLGSLGTTGRLVVNAVTIETEAVLVASQARYGGQLTKISVARSDAVGSFTAFRPALPVTQWSWNAADRGPQRGD